MKQSLYLFKRDSDGAYKIGISSDVRLRVSTLKASLDCGIEIVCSGPAKFSARKKEAKFHRKFAEKNVAGEWFALSGDEVSALADEIAGGVGVFLHDQIDAAMTLKIPTSLHAELKRLAWTPPAVQINELASRFISDGLKAAKAKNAREAKKGAAS